MLLGTKPVPASSARLPLALELHEMHHHVLRLLPPPARPPTSPHLTSLLPLKKGDAPLLSDGILLQVLASTVYSLYIRGQHQLCAVCSPSFDSPHGCWITLVGVPRFLFFADDAGLPPLPR